MKLYYLKMGMLFCGWNVLYLLDKEKSKEISFKKGYELSQKFKQFTVWDNYVEPLIINQFSFIFSVSNSFIKGMISDNKNKKDLEDKLENVCSKD